MVQTIHTYTKTDLKTERPKHVAWSFVRILHRISSAGSTAIDPKTTRNDDPVFKSCFSPYLYGLLHTRSLYSGVFPNADFGCGHLYTTLLINSTRIMVYHNTTSLGGWYTA